jgi:hypothetical protein
MFSCAHEQKHMGVRLIGVANKTLYLRRLWALPNDLKHNGADFSTTSIDLLCLWVAQIPRSRHLAIFVLTTDRHANRLLYPLLRMRAHRVIMDNVANILHVKIVLWYGACAQMKANWILNLPSCRPHPSLQLHGWTLHKRSMQYHSVKCVE